MAENECCEMAQAGWPFRLAKESKARRTRLVQAARLQLELGPVAYPSVEQTSVEQTKVRPEKKRWWIPEVSKLPSTFTELYNFYRALQCAAGCSQHYFQYPSKCDAPSPVVSSSGYR